MTEGTIIMLRHLAIFLVLAVALTIGFFVFQVVPRALRPAEARLVIDEKADFKVDIVDNPISRARGLSGREQLEEDKGMLFVFDFPGMYGFWMKDMKFPIDIVWISEGVIVGVADNLQPNDGPDRMVYYPPIGVDMVLEINAGMAGKYMIRKGDKTIVNYQ